MVLESEFNFNDEVYILKDSDIIKTKVRMVKFPSVSRFTIHPDNTLIQYGCCTEEDLKLGETMQETESWYDWRFANKMGKTIEELAKKLK